ncbi:hypothetical protein BDV93DRAFT_253246 [Ceratobasidium sp. AG-I]|nr:hypothetical protein BDV93DRAFT_253246 [Ceratobasidium sp. AG-I]
MNEIDSRPQLGQLGQSAGSGSADADSTDMGISVGASGRSNLGLDAGARSPLGLDPGVRSPLGLDTTPGRPSASPMRERFPLSSPARERFPLSSPVQERFGLPTERYSPSNQERYSTAGGERFPTPSQDRFPASSLPTRYANLPPLSPLGQATMAPGMVDFPRPLPPALESVPPSPADSAWALRRAASRERRAASGERGVRGASGERGSRERTGRGLFGESVLPPLPERGFLDRDRTMTPPGRDRTISLAGDGRAGSPSIRERAMSTHTMSPAARERTLSLARRNRTMLTSRDDVEAAVQLMTASFQASFAPPSAPASPAIESGRRQIGNEEIVGRLEMDGSGSVGTFGAGSRGGSVREGRDTDGWRGGGEWDQRMGGWR